MTVHWDAVIPALAVVAAAGIPSLLNHMFLRKNIGKKNGKGNVVEMSEALIQMFVEHAKLDDVRFREISEHIETSAESVKENTNTRAQGIVDSQEAPHTVVDVIHHDGEPA